MQLYYHKTDGGAEYYCVGYNECPNGHKEGDVRTAIMRTDGGKIEIFTNRLKEYNIKLVID